VDLENTARRLNASDMKFRWGFRCNNLLKRGNSHGDPHGDLLRSYDECVEAYTVRKLSYASDALDAFSGIGKALAIQHNTRLHFGLPVILFDSALIWNTSFESVRCNDLPTWSWTTWSGRRAMPYAHSPVIKSWIVWFYDDPESGFIRPLDDLRVLKDGNLAPQCSDDTCLNKDPNHDTSHGSEQLNARTTHIPPMFQEYCGDLAAVHINPVPDPHLDPLQSGTLRCYTLCTEFTVFVNLDPRSLRSQKVSIKDKHGIICGEIESVHDVIALCPPHLVGRQHFVIMSENPVYNDVGDAYPKMLKERGLKYEISDREGYEFKVLLVDWHNGYATRKGVGAIQRIALWHALERPIWKQVVLR